MVFRVCTLLAVLYTLVSVFCEDSFSLLSSVLTETRLSVDRCGKAGKVKLSNISDMIAPMKTLNDHCASLIYKYVLSYNNGSRLFKKGGLSRLESFFADPIHWENNLGNAMYCSADAYALHRFCGPRMKKVYGIFGIDGSRMDVDVRKSQHGCLLSTYCRDPRHGDGVCWGSYGWALLLPEISEIIEKRFDRLQINSSSQCTPPKDATGTTSTEVEEFAAVYVRCSNFLHDRRDGHVLLKFRYVEDLARRGVFDETRVVLLFMNIGNERICEAIADELRRRLQKLVSKHTNVHIVRDQNATVDLFCLIRASVLVIASWGSTFGHWAGFLSSGCSVLMPILEGRTRIGGKFGYAIQVRDGLSYIKINSSQYVEIKHWRAIFDSGNVSAAIDLLS